MILLLGGGCSLTPGKSSTRRQITLTPGWQQVKRGAIEAFNDSSTWVPLAGAAVFGLTNLDQRVSDYARAKTPVFGSTMGAMNTSDKMLHSAGTIFWVTTLATPFSLVATNNFSLTPQYTNALSYTSAGGFAVGLTNGFTGEIKRRSKRWRPNHGSNDSLPSAHASSSAVLTNVSRNNIHNLTSNTILQKSADIGLGTLAGATAWARVEGGVHYPSDVLLGIALANYFSTFVSRAFITQNDGGGLNLQLIKIRDQTGIAIKIDF